MLESITLYGQMMIAGFGGFAFGLVIFILLAFWRLHHYTDYLKLAGVWIFSILLFVFVKDGIDLIAAYREPIAFYMQTQKQSPGDLWSMLGARLIGCVFGLAGGGIFWQWFSRS